MLLLVNAVVAGSEAPIAWISLQQDWSISVGLRDRAFISPRFDARQDIFNIDNRVTVQYLVPDSPDQLRQVTNPHLTFHPPIYFHLHANSDQELFSGIADVSLILADESRVPWIRFTSRVLSQLPSSGPPRDTSDTSILRVPMRSSHASVGLGVDYVQPGVEDASGGLLDHFVDWGRFRLHIFCEERPAQLATLAWYHQC